MKTKKRIRILSLICAVILTLSFAGCSTKTDNNTGNTTNTTNTDNTGSTEPAESSWPEKTIQIIVPFNAGGDSDFNARTYANYLEDVLGVSVVVVNISGAGGSIGATQVKDSDADGYTLLLGDTNVALNLAAGVSDFGYEAFTVANICGKNPGEFITVRKDFPADTMDELIALTQEHPDEYKIAANTGATSHYVASVLKKLGAKFNVVNSGSSSERVAALAGKHVDVICNAMGTIKSYVEAGEFKIIANTSTTRAAAYPDIPTCLEQGVDLSYDMYYSMLFPKGTDSAIIEKFNAAVKQISEMQDYADAISKTYGQEPIFMDVEDATTCLQADKDKFMAFKDEFSTGK